MKKVIDRFSRLWELSKGKKSYIAGAALILYGVLEQKIEAILTGLALMGVRHGITTEVNRMKE